MRYMLALAWEGCQGAEAALVSSRTTVPLSLCKNNFPPSCSVAQQAALLLQLLNPPSSPPTQQVGNQPTNPEVEDSLLKRRKRTPKYHLAYSFSLYAPPPPPSSPFLWTLSPATLSWCHAVQQAKKQICSRISH